MQLLLMILSSPAARTPRRSWPLSTIKRASSRWLAGLAELNVPGTFRYLGPDDAQAVLVRLWHNPPGPKPLGMLVPADTSLIDPTCWVATVEYLEEGHVDDKDAEKIDYTSLLAQMKKDVDAADKERVEKGYPSLSLIGWAAPPRYDAQTHKLYWAKEIDFGNATEHTLNYNIRVLGRKGVLLLNIIAPMSRLDDIEKAAPDVLSMVDFNKGNQYADFDSSTDKLATYGIAALVAGGVAAKMGLFKVILVGLLAAKKFVIIGAAAVSAWFKKLFKKKEKNPTVESK
jgi:uncharacterized membrane-anchored protein